MVQGDVVIEDGAVPLLTAPEYSATEATIRTSGVPFGRGSEKWRGSPEKIVRGLVREPT